MKKKLRLLVLTSMVFSLIGLTFSPTASAVSSYNDSIVNSQDLYLNEETETVLIEDTRYTYDYSYEDGNKTIFITNNVDNSVEKVSYDEKNSIIYYNDEVVGNIEGSDNSDFSETSYSARSIWSTVSTSSEYISWARGISTAALAAIIAVPLAGLGGAGVIAAMGTTGLSVLAAGAIGGTVHVELQRFQPTFGAPQHRYIWSFTASTGDSYGPYIYHV